MKTKLRGLENIDIVGQLSEAAANVARGTAPVTATAGTSVTELLYAALYGDVGNLSVRELVNALSKNFTEGFAYSLLAVHAFNDNNQPHQSTIMDALDPERTLNIGENTELLIVEEVKSLFGKHPNEDIIVEVTVDTEGVSSLHADGVVTIRQVRFLFPNGVVLQTSEPLSWTLYRTLAKGTGSFSLAYDAPDVEIFASAAYTLLTNLLREYCLKSPEAVEFTAMYESGQAEVARMRREEALLVSSLQVVLPEKAEQRELLATLLETYPLEAITKHLRSK